MAELFVRVVDKVNDDFYLNCQCTKRGDVISVQPDGWNWGTDELSNSEYRIVKTDLTEDEASVFLSPERDIDPSQPSKTLQPRAFKIDLDNFEIDNAGLRNFFDDGEILSITPQIGKTLDEIKETIVTQSVVEDVKFVNNELKIEKSTISNTDIFYPVDMISGELKQKLNTLSVTKVNPVVRKNVVAFVSGGLLNKLKVAKKPVEDPKIIGISNNIF